MRQLAAISMALMLIGCVAATSEPPLELPPPDSVVADAASAIRIAQNACREDLGNDPGHTELYRQFRASLDGPWLARFQKGARSIGKEQWPHSWQVMGGRGNTSALCGEFLIVVDAVTGKRTACMICEEVIN